MTKDRIQDFFDHIILKYNCSDLERLLGSKFRACGPLLACTSIGIDTLGGMIYGFDAGSGKRSASFMKNWMGFIDEQSALIYSLVRCGLFHQGITDERIGFYVDYERMVPNVVLHRKDDRVILNVTELAYKYLSAVERVASDRKVLKAVPAPSTRDDQIFKAALQTIPSIDDQYVGYFKFGRGSGSGWNGFLDWLQSYSDDWVQLFEDNPYEQGGEYGTGSSAM